MTNQQLLDTLNAIPDEPMTKDEIDAVLREGGLDPDEVQERGKQFVERELAALIDERALGRAALHNVTVLGDPHGAVLELLQALNALDDVVAEDVNSWREAKFAARERLQAARFRFHITASPQLADVDAKEART